MFPQGELALLDDRSPEIEGLTTIDEIYSRVCEWVSPESGISVFPDRSLSMIEDNVNLDGLFV